jgi:hypothetical protein
MRKQLLAGIISALLIFCVGYVESAFALNPNLRQVVLAPSLEQQVRAILKKSGGSLYLPSPATCFTDSAGTTPCGVDDPVGFLMDTGQGGLSNLGVNKLLNATGLGTIDSGWSVSSVNRTYTATAAAAFTAGRILFPAINVSTAFFVEYTLIANSGSVRLQIAGGAGVNGATRSTSGNYSEIILANAGNNSVNFQAGGSGFDGVISNVSIREVPGNHATQTTAGFKPILRGKVKNWLVNTATLSTQTVSVAASGVTWTLQFKGTGSVAISGGYTGNLAGIGANNLVSLSFTTNSASNLTFTVTGSVTEAMLELGSVANPYVASGPTPKSSSYGPYWLDFDGVDDRLQLNNVPLSLVDNMFISVSMLGLNPSTWLAAYSQANSTDSTTYIANGFHNNGSLRGIWADSTSKSVVDSVSSIGLKVINTITKSSDVKEGFKNSRSYGSNSTALTAATHDRAAIGAQPRPTYENFFNGAIYAIALGKVTLSKIDLNKIEKYLAKKAEISL